MVAAVDMVLLFEFQSGRNLEPNERVTRTTFLLAVSQTKEPKETEASMLYSYR
jgi:hypothetical protein